MFKDEYLLDYINVEDIDAQEADKFRTAAPFGG